MKYNLIVDEKKIVWRRNHVEVEADSLEEAIELAKNDECTITDSEFIFETEEPVDPDVKPSIEVFDEHYKLLYTDGEPY